MSAAMESYTETSESHPLGPVLGQAEVGVYMPHNIRKDTLDIDVVGLYFKDIGKESLLDKEEELALAESILAGHEASQKLSDESYDGSTEEINQLEADRWSGQKASRTLVQKNLRLVPHIARRFTASTIPYADLIQEGNLALMQAADRYDYRYGYRFTTYAGNIIHLACRRAMTSNGRSGNITVEAADNIAKMQSTRVALAAELGNYPTDDQLIDRLGWDEERLIDTLKAKQFVHGSYSMQDAIGEERIRADVMPMPNDASHFYRPETIVMDGVGTRQVLRSILAHLSQEDRELFVRRHYEGVGIRELAEANGQNEQKVGRDLRRIAKYLRGLVEGGEYHDSGHKVEGEVKRVRVPEMPFKDIEASTLTLLIGGDEPAAPFEIPQAA